MMQQRNRNTKRAEADKDAGAANPPEKAKAEAPAAEPTRAPTSPTTADAQVAKRGGRILLIVLIVIAAAALAYHYMISGQGQQAATSAAPPAPPVTVAKPLVKELREWRDFTGQFAAPDAVEIRARVSGYLGIGQLQRRSAG